MKELIEFLPNVSYYPHVQAKKLKEIFNAWAQYTPISKTEGSDKAVVRRSANLTYSHIKE